MLHYQGDDNPSQYRRRDTGRGVLLRRLIGGLAGRLARLALGDRAPDPGAEAERLMREAVEAEAGGDRATAAGILERLVARFPSHAAGHRLLGVVRGKDGELERALSHIERAVALAPAWPDAHVAHGNVRLLLGDAGGAEESYRSAIALDPGGAAAHYNLAFLLQNAGRAEESLQLLQRAYDLEPGHPDAIWELVKALLDAGDLEAARPAAERALAADPASAAAHRSLGLVHLWQQAPQDALECFRRATGLARADVEGWLHVGITAQELARLDEALAAYEQALELRPDYAPARLRRALVRLTKGEFDPGWSDYEARLASASHPQRCFPQPRWQGEPLGGKTLLIHAEQGLGDEIMFASCLPELIARAGHCVVDCHPRLAPIFGRSFPAATVHGGMQTDGLAWIAQYPPADYQIQTGSVPRILRSRLEDFPHHAGYLRADPQRIAAWEARLTALGKGLKVGLSWQGGTRLSRSRLRSLSLEQLLPVLQVAGVHFVDLQYTETTCERARLAQVRGIELVHWPEAIADFDETAALVAALDLTLSVCTTVVHLAGALGKPVWVLTPFSPEWRYGHAGDRMVWYPEARLYRQARYDDWEPVIAAVVRDLERRAVAGGPDAVAARPGDEEE